MFASMTSRSTPSSIRKGRSAVWAKSVVVCDHDKGNAAVVIHLTHQRKHLGWVRRQSGSLGLGQALPVRFVTVA